MLASSLARAAKLRQKAEVPKGPLVACCYSRLQGGGAKVEVGRSPIAPGGPARQLRELGRDGVKNLLPRHGVERVFKVQLEHMRRSQVWCRVSQARVACTAASVPPGTATPIRAGAKCSPAAALAWTMRHLPVRRRSTSPIAMGRSPPFSLGTGPAPASTCAASSQACPRVRKDRGAGLSRPRRQHKNAGTAFLREQRRLCHRVPPLPSRCSSEGLGSAGGGLLPAVAKAKPLPSSQD